MKNSGYEAVFTPSDAQNYDYSGIELVKLIDVKVNKAEQSALSYADFGTKTFGDAPFSLNVSGGSGNGTVSYRAEGGSVSVDENGTVTILSAGDSTVTVTKAADDNYNEKTVQITISVGKKTAAKPAVNGTYYYNGSAQSVALDVLENYMTVTGDAEKTDAGSYEIEIILDGNHKWADGTDGRLTWEIKKAQSNTVTELVMDGWTYGNAASEPTAKATFGTPEFTYSDSADGVYTSAKPTNAGTYYVKAAVADRQQLQDG